MENDKFVDRVGATVAFIAVVVFFYLVGFEWFFKLSGIACLLVIARSGIVLVIKSDRPINNLELAGRSVMSFLIGLVSVVVGAAIILA